MKRLLCVLMVMVMAVLMVPTAMAESMEDYCPCCKGAELKFDSGGSYDGGDYKYTWFCTKCCYRRWTGEVEAQPIKGMLECTPGDWEVVKEPTATEPGKKVRKCNNKKYEGGGVCGRILAEEEIPPLGTPEVIEEPHVHAEEWVPGTPATCTSTGLTDGSKCKWCGEVLKAQTEIPKIDHVYSMWVPNGSGKHFASCLYCGNKIDAACEKVQLPIKSTSGAAITLCPVCGDCNGATATAVKGSQVGEGAPYRGTLRVWNIDAGDGNKYLAVSFDRFGKIMQPEGEVSVTLPDDLKGTTAGVIGADGSVKTVQESNGTLKLDFTGSQVVVLKVN